MSLFRSFIRGFFRIGSSSKELANMEKKLNAVLAKNFDNDKESFVKDTTFVPEMQTRINELLFFGGSIEKANRVAELSVMLDRLEAYRKGEVDELMLIPKRHGGRSLLNFNIVRVTNHSRRNSLATRLATNKIEDSNQEEQEEQEEQKQEQSKEGL